MIKLDLSQAIVELKKLQAKKVFVQIPEGIKVNTEEVADILQKAGFEAQISMDACFGACDVKPDEAKRNGCDTLLHIGHTKFVDTQGIPIVYAPLHYELEGFDATKEQIKHHLLDKSITHVGLTTTVQFLPYLPELQSYLEKNGIRAEIGKGRRVSDGQVLGCNYSPAQVTAPIILYLGDGFFHPLGIHFGTKKEVIIANPRTGEILTLDKQKDDFLRKRILLIERAKETDSYAVLVSTKVGQNKISIANTIKKDLEAAGKKAVICTMDFVAQDKLLGMQVGAYINTACPRISIDDYANYKKPMINYNEVKYLLGKSYDDFGTEVIY